MDVKDPTSLMKSRVVIARTMNKLHIPIQMNCGCGGDLSVVVESGLEMQEVLGSGRRNLSNIG